MRAEDHDQGAFLCLRRGTLGDKRDELLVRVVPQGRCKKGRVQVGHEGGFEVDGHGHGSGGVPYDTARGGLEVELREDERGDVTAAGLGAVTPAREQVAPVAGVPGDDTSPGLRGEEVSCARWLERGRRYTIGGESVGFGVGSCITRGEALETETRIAGAWIPGGEGGGGGCEDGVVEPAHDIHPRLGVG